jgi:hypothetical protein
MKKNYIQIHKTGITKQTSVSIHNFGCRKRIKVTFGCTKSGITKPVLVLTRSSIKHYGCRKRIKDTSRCKKTSFRIGENYTLKFSSFCMYKKTRSTSNSKRL